MSKKHPAPREWVRYSRGLIASRRRQQMQRHLDEGCGRCAAALNLQRSAGADADSRTAPPDRAVHEIKGLFTRDRPPQRSWLASEHLDLVFDSSREPAGAGSRSRGVGRQLVLESEKFALDLQLTPGPSRGSLTGELARRDGAALSRIPAYLVVDDQVAGQAMSDDGGVFELAADLSDSVELWLQVARRERIVVRLDPLR